MGTGGSSKGVFCEDLRRMAKMRTTIDNQIQIRPIGDQGLIIQFKQQISPDILSQVLHIQKLLEKKRNEWPELIELVPAFASLTVYFDICQISFREMREKIYRIMDSNSKTHNISSGKLIEIPVCYGGVYGEDLQEVAKNAGLTPNEVVRIHSGKEYLIYMLGFLPGFPYLGGLDPRIATPRKKTPRTRIPAGSIGIGGEQTGIYPIASPGGWQLIGRTPLRLFQKDLKSGIEVPIYQSGDRIRFVPIQEQEYSDYVKKTTD